MLFAPVDLLVETRRGCGAMMQEPGKALAAKLCAHLRPKCHALLLDASLSSAITVRRNIFQMALLAAMKLHCQVSPSILTIIQPDAQASRGMGMRSQSLL